MAANTDRCTHPAAAAAFEKTAGCSWKRPRSQPPTCTTFLSVLGNCFHVFNIWGIPPPFLMLLIVSLESHINHPSSSQRRISAGSPRPARFPRRIWGGFPPGISPRCHSLWGFPSNLICSIKIKWYICMFGLSWRCWSGLEEQNNWNGDRRVTTWKHTLFWFAFIWVITKATTPTPLVLLVPVQSAVLQLLTGGGATIHVSNGIFVLLLMAFQPEGRSRLPAKFFLRFSNPTQPTLTLVLMLMLTLTSPKLYS